MSIGSDFKVIFEGNWSRLMPAATNEEFFNGRLGACLKIRVRAAQATGLGRLATCRTAWRRHPNQ